MFSASVIAALFCVPLSRPSLEMVYTRNRASAPLAPQMRFFLAPFSLDIAPCYISIERFQEYKWPIKKGRAFM
jgi:hypothetical protein